MKKVLFILFLICLFIGNFFYHKATLNYIEFSKSSPTISKLFKLKMDYLHYFWQHDPTPLYTFKNDLLTNYQKYSFLEHKSWLIFPNQETLADLKYISDIQYLAQYRNIYEAKQLYTELNYVTNLSPFRPGIYSLGLLILPASIEAKTDFVTKLTSWHQATKLWEKWIFFNCNKEKIKAILSLPDKTYLKYAYEKTWNFYRKYSNPCKTIDLPQQLWFDYFYYLKDLKNAVKYYKVAWFMKDALWWIIWMVWVINWILGEHEKWMYLLLTKANTFYERLQKAENEKERKLYQDQLTNSIKRAQAELNFYIVSQADQNHPECNKSYKCLVKNGYIQKQIEKLLNYCLKTFNPYKIKTLEDIFSKNINYSISNAKCFLLGLNIKDGYTTKNWLKTVLRKNGTYYYNPELQTWREK